MTKGRSYINSYADRIMRENMIEEVGTLLLSLIHIWSARQLAGELRHSPVHRDASHEGSFSMPVSYTHLDGHKRQVIATYRIVLLFPLHIQNSINRKVLYIANCCCAVSYTHLAEA